MKLGLLLPTNIYFCPYVKIYTDILDKNNIQYDIIYPDKRGLKEEAAYRYTQIKLSSYYTIGTIQGFCVRLSKKSNTTS